MRSLSSQVLALAACAVMARCPLAHSEEPTLIIKDGDYAPVSVGVVVLADDCVLAPLAISTGGHVALSTQLHKSVEPLSVRTDPCRGLVVFRFPPGTLRGIAVSELSKRTPRPGEPLFVERPPPESLKQGGEIPLRDVVASQRTTFGITRFVVESSQLQNQYGRLLFLEDGAIAGMVRPTLRASRMEAECWPASTLTVEWDSVSEVPFNTWAKETSPAEDAVRHLLIRQLDGPMTDTDVVHSLAQVSDWKTNQYTLLTSVNLCLQLDRIDLASKILAANSASSCKVVTHRLLQAVTMINGQDITPGVTALRAEAESGSFDACVVLAELCARSEKPKEASHWASRACDMQPGDERALESALWAAIAARNDDELRKAVGDLLRLCWGAEALLRIAHALDHAGYTNAAITVLEASLVRTRFKAIVALSLAEYLDKAGRSGDGLRVLREELDRHPTNRHLLRAYIRFSLRSTNNTELVPTVLQILRTSPNVGMVWTAFGELAEAERGDLLAEYSQGIGDAKVPQDLCLGIQLAVAARHEPKNKAYEAANIAERKYPNSAAVMFGKAVVLASRQNWKEARAYCDKAVELDPTNAIMLELAAQCCEACGDVDRALEYARRVETVLLQINREQDVSYDGLPMRARATK